MLRCLALAGLIALLTTAVVLSQDKPNPDALIAQLLNASKERESLRTPDSFDELRLSPAQLAVAKKLIQDLKDYRAYHLLFAVKNTSEKAYEIIPTDVKIRVLTSALREQSHLNDWGHLEPKESYDGPVAKALLALGKGAIEQLEPTLKDSTRAPLFGSEATMSSTFRYRRKDFAYRYIMLLLDREPEFAGTPRQRDKAIEALKKELPKLKPK
jgi:hypothetical protein